MVSLWCLFVFFALFFFGSAPIFTNSCRLFDRLELVLLQLKKIAPHLLSEQAVGAILHLRPKVIQILRSKNKGKD